MALRAHCHRVQAAHIIRGNHHLLQERPRVGEQAHRVVERVADQQLPQHRHADPAWRARQSLCVRPGLELQEEAALKVEDLDALVRRVADEDLLLVADADVHGAVASLPPAAAGRDGKNFDQLQLRVELHSPTRRADNKVVVVVTGQAVGGVAGADLLEELPFLRKHLAKKRLEMFQACHLVVLTSLCACSLAEELASLQKQLVKQTENA